MDLRFVVLLAIYFLTTTVSSNNQSLVSVTNMKYIQYPPSSLSHFRDSFYVVYKSEHKNLQLDCHHHFTREALPSTVEVVSTSFQEGEHFSYFSVGKVESRQPVIVHAGRT